jgi:3-deoxy-D-manno-octulosonic acid kinase
VHLPSGYVDYDRGNFRVIAPRWELDEMVALLTGPERDRPSESEVHGGRGWARRVVLPGGTAVFLRKYLRGGFPRLLVRDLFILRPERPIRELVVTEAARAAGCPVPHVLAVAIEEALIGYRGWIVTEALDGVRPLIDVYTERDERGRVALLKEVGTAIRKLHAAGIYHVDLTGYNVLVDATDRISFVDFDRSFQAVPDSGRWARAGRHRFWRSMAKLTAARSVALPAASIEWLAEGYRR